MGNDVYGSLGGSLQSLWAEVMQFVPELLLALLIIIVGWIIGGILGGVVQRLFVRLHIDDALDKAGVDELSKRAGYSFKPGHFAGALVKWFFILAFAVVAFDILGLSAVTSFVRVELLGYLPNVFVAMLILFAAMLIANVASKALVATLRTSGIGRPEFLGKVSYYLIIAFGVIAALSELKIADELVETLFTGVIFALSLALGLAFGLGGKDTAARYLNRVTRD